MLAINVLRMRDRSSWRATLTVASGKVASDLTNYPLYIDLADMPASFWANTNNGKDLRAFIGGTQVPVDVVWCSVSEKKGAAFVKVPTLATGSTTTITLTGTGNTGREANNATYGRNAVWADYKVVTTLGRDAFNRTGGTTLRVLGDPDLFDEVATQGPFNVHDGITTDGTYFYIFHGNEIRKYTTAWSLVATNSDPAGDSGLALVNDLGDGCYHDGKLYVPLGDNPGGTVQYIGVYDASDLSFIQAFDISATGISASGFAYNPADGLLWSIRWNSGTHLLKYNPASGAFIGSVALSLTLLNAQGIEIWEDAVWISTDSSGQGNHETFRVEFDGTVTTSGLFGSRDEAATDFWAGLCASGAALMQADDQTPGYIRTYKPFSIAKGAGGGAEFWADARIVADLASTGALGTSWTLGCTYSPADDTQRTVMALCETGTGFAANVHVDVDDGNKIGVWDQSNSWQYTSPNVDPALNTCHRVNVVYNGTTSRSIYHNGGSKGTDTTITTRGSGVGHVVLGAAREGDATSSWRGQLGFAYARASVLSDAWIAGEYSNISAPSSFYSIS